MKMFAKIKLKNVFFSLFLFFYINCGNSQNDKIIKFLENPFCQNPTLDKKFAIIVHGWLESCEESWITKLIENLNKYRGGCIICMDYSSIAQMPQYFKIASYHTDISIVLANKLQQLESLGFDPNQGYMFGFSLGGRIVIEAGRMFGKQKIAEIDTCDMAGPGFDLQSEGQLDPKESAQNVQCIHTSRNKGTIHRNCHQDWNMGFCGYHQIGAIQPPFGSHGLCTEFYNSAFENDFYAEKNPKQCKNIQIEHSYWPKNFKMGYMENRKNYVFGEFYASTTKNFPYTPTIPRIQISIGPTRPLDGYQYKLIMVLNNKGKLFNKQDRTIEGSIDLKYNSSEI